MEGYSVTEAASILGVPTERVWELLARGVLAGTPEGEAGMRVFLQPRPAPAPPVIEARAPNGDPGSREPERELSPFRELLTEFRNLTERYGQALLALGESRGEVAALRSRVDLLEARMDLRLPMSSAAPSPWPSPATASDVPPIGAETALADAPLTDALRPDEAPHAEGEEHRRRRRGHRRATESFAEALARAEDPTRPELPGAAETAAAMAALRAEPAHDEAALPRELPAAEPMPTPEEPQEAVSVEPAVTADVGSDTSGAATETAGLAPEPSEAAARVEEVALEPDAAIAETPGVGQAETVEPEVPETQAVEPPAPDTETAEAELAEAEPVDSESVEAEAEAPAPQAPESAAAEAEVAELTTTDEVAAESEAAEDESAESEQVGSHAEPAISEDASRAAAATEPVASPVAEEEPEPEPEPIAFDPERYTVDIIEPDWYADEESSGFPGSTVQPEASDERAGGTDTAEPEASKREESEAAVEHEATEPEATEHDAAEPGAAEHEAAEPAVAEHATEAPRTEIAAEVAQEHASAAPTPSSAEGPAVEAPAASAADAVGEETMLWFGRAPQQSQPGEPGAPVGQVDEGADEMEVVGAAAPRPDAAALPGSRELDDALAALDAVVQPGPEAALGAADEGWPPAADADLSEMQSGADVTPPEPESSTGTSLSAGLLPSVRPQTTPASRAYRRLRRIFPG